MTPKSLPSDLVKSLHSPEALQEFAGKIGQFDHAKASQHERQSTRRANDSIACGLLRCGATIIGNYREKPSDDVMKLAGPSRAWHINARNVVRFMIEVGLRPSHRLIDIGCGPLRAGLPLISYLNSGNYVGFDVRPNAIAAARERLTDRGLWRRNPNIFCGSFDLDISEADFGLAFSVFIHLTDDLVSEAMRFVASHITGRCYANVSVGDRKEGKWVDFPSMSRPIEFYEAAARDAGLSIRWLHLDGWKRAWWFRHEVMELRRSG